MVKEAPLVSQYLERISRGAVDKYRDLFRTYVRHRQGVYALYKGKNLYYVGLASDLRWRLHQHLKDHHGRSWDRFSVYFTIGAKHLKELETLILHITGKPPGNENAGKFQDSENLKRILKKDIKAFQRRELMELIGQEVEEESSRPRKKGDQRQPPLGPYIRGAFRIRARYKGRLYKARVRRDGSVRYKGKTYNSPSAAGIAVRKKSTDGWYFWKYERAPGDWMKLNELRK